MTNRLHVGNLAPDTTAATLTDAFARDGRQVVAVQLVMTRVPQRSRGFAFVEMASAEQAASAQVAIDGATIDGRQVRVSIAHPPKSRFGGRIQVPTGS